MCLQNRITKCCSAPILRLSGREFPDGKTFFISTSWDACSNPKCEAPEWPDTYKYRCDNCGDGTDFIVEVESCEYCRDCADEYHAHDLMEAGQD